MPLESFSDDQGAALMFSIPDIVFNLLEFTNSLALYLPSKSDFAGFCLNYFELHLFLKQGPNLLCSHVYLDPLQPDGCSLRTW